VTDSSLRHLALDLFDYLFYVDVIYRHSEACVCAEPL
jgi:hypothetical protein